MTGLPVAVRTVLQTGRDDTAPSGTVPTERTDGRAQSATGQADRPANPSAGTPGDAGHAPPGRTGDPGHRAAPVDIRTVAHLIPAARAARAVLARDGRSLSRDALADAMREDGTGVSNERASLLLKILKAEAGVTPIAPTGTAAHDRRSEDRSDTAA